MTEFYPLLVVAVLFTIWVLRRIIYLFDQNTRKLVFLFNSIANGDYSFKFTEYEGPVSDNLLNMALNQIRALMWDTRQDIIQKEKYYELILNSVNTGILAINDNGAVYQFNDEALKLMGLDVLTHINQLKRIDPALTEILSDIRSGEKKQISYVNERGTVTLSLRASALHIEGKRMRIIAIQEIGNELEEKELDSWIKLIRVMTHEIMNSIAPITSLSETLIELNGEEDSEMRDGLEVIRSTSKSLISFVDSYRRFTRIPVPRKELFFVGDLLRRHQRLIACNFPHLRIDLQTDRDDLILHADENLISQVMTNLLRNAAQEADKTQAGTILIRAFCDEEEHVVIEVTDNGRGVPVDLLPHIFVPFFTTKEEGTGIGLSISRQIMRMHDGTISVYSVPGKTTFRLIFK